MNRNQILSIFILLACALVTAACSPIVRGSGTLITESREASGFKQIALTGSGNVTVIQGTEESLTIRTDDNVMQHISTEVKGDTLYLGMENGTISLSYTELNFIVTVKELEAVAVSGSGDINIAKLMTEQLDIDLSGSGDVKIAKLTAEQLDINIVGSSDVSLRGRVDSQEVRISGSGSYYGSNLQSDTAEIAVIGSGDVAVWAKDELEISITGSGDVQYYGDPQLATSSRGSGDISQAKNS